MPAVFLVVVAGVTFVAVVLVALVVLIAATDGSRSRVRRPAPVSPRTLTAERRRIRVDRANRSSPPADDQEHQRPTGHDR